MVPPMDVGMRYGIVCALEGRGEALKFVPARIVASEEMLGVPSGLAATPPTSRQIFGCPLLISASSVDSKLFSKCPASPFALPMNAGVNSAARPPAVERGSVVQSQ